MTSRPAEKRESITHVLFDMDGLLLGTETIYTVVQEDICQKYGRQFTWDLKAKMMGQKALDAAQILVTELALEGQLSAEDFLAQREAALEALFLTSPLLPGAERLLRHLRRCGVPAALATSSHRRHYDLKTTQHRELFAAAFDHVVTGDLVSAGKPDPEIFLAAAAAWDPAPQPGNCLVFEDAPSGVQAARAAGMRCVMVPDPKLDPALHGGEAVLDSLLDFRPEDWGLPPFPASP